jgi:hypothetical protein
VTELSTTTGIDNTGDIDSLGDPLTQVSQPTQAQLSQLGTNVTEPFTTTGIDNTGDIDSLGDLTNTGILTNTGALQLKRYAKCDRAYLPPLALIIRVISTA